MMAAELLDCLKELRLPAVRELYLEQAEQARREGHSYEHYLAELMEHEVEQRRHKRVARMPHESSLPLEKTIDRARARPATAERRCAAEHTAGGRLPGSP